MKKILCGAVFLGLGSLAFSQSQLDKWFRAPRTLEFTQTYGATYTNTGVPIDALGRGYNSISENGNLLFYIADGWVYSVQNGNHNDLGTLDTPSKISGDEYAIIPHPENYTKLCDSKKFYILYTLKSGNNSFADGEVQVALVDMNDNGGLGSMNTNLSSSIIQELKQNTDRVNCPMAVGPVRTPSFERFIYMQGRVVSTQLLPGNERGLIIYKLTASGEFNYVGNYTTNLPDGREMELSNAGDKLAYTGAGGQITVLTLNPSTGMVSSASTFTASSPVGLEFDNTGGKLYYTQSGGQTPGVHVKTLSTGVSSFIIGTSGFGGGFLEKSYTDGATPTEIICGDNNTLRGINPLTDALNAWTTTGWGADIMPDQIDGEYADAMLIKLRGANHICYGSAAVISITGAPMITASTHSMSIYNGAVTGFNNSTFTTAGLGATTQTPYHIFYNGNPSCVLNKTWTTHVNTCTGTPTIVVTPVFNQNYYRLAAQPNDPSTVTGSAWYLSELSSVSNAEVFSINNPPCWQLSTTATNVFNGFFPNETNNYDGNISTLPCSGNDEGKFLYNRTYRITRETWTGKDPHQFFSVIVRNGIVIDPTSVPVPKSMHIGDATEQGAFAISPNPSTGILTVELGEGTESASIGIYNELGALVKSVQQTTSTAEMDLSNLPKGVYIVKIVSEATMTTKKIILK